MRIFRSVLGRSFNTFPSFSHSAISKKILFSFSEAQAENKMIYEIGELNVRNSQTLELKLREVSQSRKTQSLIFQIGAQDNLNAISDIFDKNFDAKNSEFFCEKGIPISKFTPVEVFLNRSFSIVNLQSGYKIIINGQLLFSKLDESRLKASNQLKENLSQLELPVIAQREIQAYFNRVSTWLDAKYGSNQKTKIKEKQIQDILVQAIVDPQCHWHTVNVLQETWFKKYVEIRELRDKKNEALKISEKMAVRKMSLGLGLIAANIGFIWSGTYVFFSWDIVEPIAYFTSSLTSIILFGQILKIKKPFSLQNYREYLINQYLPRSCEKIGLNLSDLETKEMELQVVESVIKDYLIAKL